MVCQAAGQTRFRALKYENGIAGSATIVVRVIACFQPLQDCQVFFSFFIFHSFLIFFVQTFMKELDTLMLGDVCISFVYISFLNVWDSLFLFFLLLIIGEKVYAKPSLNFLSWVFARLNISDSCLSPLRRLVFHFRVQVKLEFLVFSFVFERNCK